MRSIPSSQPREPEVTDDERKQFVSRFILGHLATEGDACDEYFRQWLPHHKPEITKSVEVNQMGTGRLSQQPGQVSLSERPKDDWLSLSTVRGKNRKEISMGRATLSDWQKAKARSEITLNED